MRRMRVESLTFLRFLAALIVVAFHYGRYTCLSELRAPAIFAGPQMVTFFFTLSGFVMLISHYNRERESAGKYYLLRIARIVPVYLLALALIVLVARVSTAPLLLSLSLVQAWVPRYALSVNGPGWSLSVETFFYLTFPLILLWIRRRNVKTSHMILLATITYVITQAVLSTAIAKNPHAAAASTAHALICYFPPSHLCSFLLGVAAGLIYVRNPESFNSNGKAQFILFGVVTVTVLLLLENPWFLQRLVSFPLAYGSSFYALPFAIMILAFAASKNFITNAISLPFFVFLGEISYTMYILQEPVHIEWITATHRLALSPDLSFFAFVTTLILISVMVYHFFERPAKRAVMWSGSVIARKIKDRQALGTAELVDE